MLKRLRILWYAPELYHLMLRAVQHVMGNINRAKEEGISDWQDWLPDLKAIQDLLRRIEK